jgi:hypothetical protein
MSTRTSSNLPGDGARADRRTTGATFLAARRPGFACDGFVTARPSTWLVAAWRHGRRGRRRTEDRGGVDGARGCGRAQRTATREDEAPRPTCDRTPPMILSSVRRQSRCRGRPSARIAASLLHSGPGNAAAVRLQLPRTGIHAAREHALLPARGRIVAVALIERESQERRPAGVTARRLVEEVRAKLRRQRGA